MDSTQSLIIDLSYRVLGRLIRNCQLSPQKIEFDSLKILKRVGTSY